MSTATLKWTDPVIDASGNPLPAGALTSIDVFNQAPPSPAIGNVMPGVGTFTTLDLPAGDYVFTVIANGHTTHSPPSNVVPLTIAPTEVAPASITDLTVTSP